MFIKAYPVVSINLFFTSTFTLPSHISQILINDNEWLHLKYKNYPVCYATTTREGGEGRARKKRPFVYSLSAICKADDLAF